MKTSYASNIALINNSTKQYIEKKVELFGIDISLPQPLLLSRSMVDSWDAMINNVIIGVRPPIFIEST